MQSPGSCRWSMLAATTVLALQVAACASMPRARTDMSTTAEITESDLRTRLSIFAADSMQGRAAGSIGHERAVRYLVSEATRLGLSPAGDHGTFLQTFHMRVRGLDPASAIEVNDRILRPTVDFRAITVGSGQLRPISGAEVIYGGVVGDTTTQITADEASGRIVVLGVPANMNEVRAFENVIYGPGSRFGSAVAVAIASLEYVSRERRGIASTVSLADAALPLAGQYATTLLVTSDAARALLGMPLRAAVAGTRGRTVNGRVSVIEDVRPTHNVVAMIRGTDPTLSAQYVVLGAHSDHLPLAPRAVDHDATRAIARERNLSRIPAEQRKLLSTGANPAASGRGAVRLDSIFNGADDDGSGSVALLEIAEMMAAAARHPRRSVLFVWHSAEEDIFMGSGWFVAHSPVPTDSIVAMLNLDMVGRGGVDDIAGGGPRYVEVIGADRRSPALLSLISDVNRRSSVPATLLTSDPDGAFCKSDQWSYARLGIPVAFFFTGDHADRHSVTDESQYIDYSKLALVSRLVAAVTMRLASGPERFEPSGRRQVLPEFCSY